MTKDKGSCWWKFGYFRYRHATMKNNKLWTWQNKIFQEKNEMKEIDKDEFIIFPKWMLIILGIIAIGVGYWTFINLFCQKEKI